MPVARSVQEAETLGGHPTKSRRRSPRAVVPAVLLLLMLTLAACGPGAELVEITATSEPIVAEATATAPPSAPPTNTPPLPTAAPVLATPTPASTRTPPPPTAAPMLTMLPTPSTRPTGAMSPTATPASATTATSPVIVPTDEPAPPPPTLSVAEAVQAEFARLSTGRVLYNPPAEMHVGQPERIEARISMDETVALAEGLVGAGEPQVEAIAVSSFMKVRLVGETFTIVAYGSEEQVVPAQGYSEWVWDVTPTQPGERNLLLIVTARVKLAGHDDEQKDLEIIERQIRVRVSPGHALGSFFAENREWIYPSVLVPLVALGARWLWRRRRVGEGAD